MAWLLAIFDTSVVLVQADPSLSARGAEAKDACKSAANGVARKTIGWDLPRLDSVRSMEARPFLEQFELTNVLRGGAVLLVLTKRPSCPRGLPYHARRADVSRILSSAECSREVRVVLSRGAGGGGRRVRSFSSIATRDRDFLMF